VSVAHLSTKARAVVERERDIVIARVADLRRQSESLHGVVDQVDRDLQSTERLLRQMDEMLGLAPQLALESVHEEIRGQRLRDIAVEVLRVRRGLGVVIHYTDWLRLLEDEGIRVGGKNPTATLLTQIAKSPHVESVRRRSGLYRLKSA
jgi:hypothetical protein